MLATIGADGLTFIAAASRVTPAEVATRPTIAVTIGRPAATTDPNASTMISSASTIPMISAYPSTGAAAVSGTAPFISTVSPAARASATASLSGSAFPIRSL